MRSRQGDKGCDPCQRTIRGGPLEKWGGGAKIKIEQGKQKKKIRALEKFEKKNSCRDFSIGKIIR